MSSVNPNVFPNVLYCLYDQRYALKGEISGEQGGIDVYAVAGTRDIAAISYITTQYPTARLFFDSGTWTIDSDITIPSTNSVYTEPGTTFAISSGITFTITGSFESGLYQVFSYADSTCNVILNNVTEIYPEWWGAEPYSVNSSDDQSTYINYAIKTAWTSTSVTTGSKKLVRLSGLYRIDNPILIPYNNIVLKGTGRYVSGLMKVANSINGIEIYRGSEIGGANAGFVDISDMTITGYETVSTADFIYSAPITGTNGIQVEGPAGEIYFSNLEVTKHRNHGIYCKEDDSGNGNWIVSIDKCIIMVNRGDGIRDALEIASGGNGNGLTLTNSLLWQNGGYGLTWSGFGLNATGNGFEANSYGGINLTVSGSGITSFGPANISGNYFEEQYLKSTSSITDITNASTTTVTAVSHGLETGDYVYLTDIGGTTELNGKTLQVTKGDDDNFSLDGIDSTNYGSYTSGGTVYPSTDDTKGCININLDDIYLFGLVAKGNMFYKGYSRVAYAGWDGAINANGTGGLLESEIGPNFFIYGIPDYHSIANISNIIKSSTTTVTALSHGFTTGQSVRVTNVGGLTEVNDETYTITKVTDDVFALNTDTSAYTATYTSGGIAFRSQEPATVDLGSLGWKGVKIHSRYSRTTSPNSYVNLGNAQVFYGIDTDINTTYTYNDTVPSSKAAKYYIDTATTSITNYLTNGFNTNEEFSTVLDLGEYSDTYSVGYITFPVGKSFLGTIDISLYPSYWYSHAYGDLSMKCSFYSAAITGSYSPSTPVSYIYEADGTLAEWYGFRPIEQDNVEGLWKIPIYHIQKVAGEKQHLYALAKVSIPTTVLSTSYNAHTLVDALDVIAPAVYTNTWTRNYVTQETLLRVQGIESGKATLELWADEGDDSTDRWSIVSETDGKLYIKNDVTTITYIDTANISATYIDRDGTLAANSDIKLSSQKAIKTYVDTQISTVSTSTFVTKSLYDANTILYATSDNTPVALTVGDQTVVGRAGSGIAALAIDSDLSSASASDNTVPSAKATKTYVDAVDTLVDTLDSNLKYYTKGQVVEAVYEIVTPANVKGLWFFNATGADTTVLDKSTIGGASAHTVNLMDATGVAAEASTLSPGYYSMAPYLTFASDDYWETNDSADFTFALSPVSVFVLCNLTDATSDSLACKFDQTTGSEQREWRFQTDASDKLTMTIWDNTAGGYIGRNCSSVVTSYEGLFTTYATTYDGGTANSGIKLYLNGAQVDDTNVSSGTFNTMQNTTSKLASYYTATTGARAVLMDGKVSFILIVAEELTAIQIRRLDNIIRSYAGYNV